MGGPWEDYQPQQQPEQGPWLDYAPQTAQVVPPKPRTWMDSVSDFAGEWWKQVNPVSAVKGLAEAARSPIQTGKALLEGQGGLEKKAEAAFKRGDYAEGVRHVLNYLVPVLGQQTDAAGDLLQGGQYAKGAGMTAGIATNIAAPEAVKGTTVKLPVGQLPERLYQSALKPSTTLGAEKTAQVVGTGLKEAIPVSQEGLEKIGGLVSNLQDAVKAEIASRPGATVNKFSVASRLGDTAQRFSRQVNPESDLQAIAESGNEFLRNQPGAIPAADAQALKSGTYRQLKGKAYGELKSATIESQKALARGIKEELETQFPEIKAMNARESQLIGLDKAVERAVARINNHQLFGLGTPLAVGAGGIATGSPIGAVAGGLIKYVLDQPELKSRLAYGLARAGGKGVTVSAAYARIAAYSQALGNALPSERSEQ